MNFKKLAYLDLEISHHRKIKVNLSDYFKIYCNVDSLNNQYKHLPHTSDSQKNFIVDLLINLGYNLEIHIEKLSEKLDNSSINTLRNNLDFIRELLAEFNNQVKRFPNKKEIIELINIIDIKTPKPVEIEIRKLVEDLGREVEKIKQTQNYLQQQLENIKKIVSE